MNIKINDDLKNAMKEKDTFKLSVLRMLKSALQLEKIAKKHELDDNEIITVINKQVKLRKDSILEYKKYNKEESVKDLEKEIEILSVYLPEEMSIEEINTLIDEVFKVVSPSSIKDMGNIMKIVNEKIAGKNADMAIISKTVKEKLSSL